MFAMSALRQLFDARAHPWRLLAAILGLALLAGTAERFAARLFEPACWIWAAGDYGDGEPIAFYAVRDLELASAGPARVVIAADETYLLYANGRRLGTGTYRPGQPLDEYDLGDFLEVGLNRILVELRSTRGAGGFFARIELEGERTETVVTDAGWRIFRSYDPGLLGGWSTLAGGEVPQVWQQAPTGRWRLAASHLRRPIPFQGFPPSGRSRPRRHRKYFDSAWLDLDWSRRRIPALGPQQVFDWGEEVEGYLAFDLRSDGGEPGLVYFGSAQSPDPQARPPDTVILPVPGRRHWEDAFPRRFRYVLVIGAEPYSWMELNQLSGANARVLAAPADNHDGVFGLVPPRSYSRVEEAVWKRLEKEAAQRNDGPPRKP